MLNYHYLGYFILTLLSKQERRARYVTEIGDRWI
jgi:hypothetical protein